MTPNDDAFRLLAEYTAGNLTEKERAELARAALDDPAVFEAMVEEEEIREALEDSVFRRRLKEHLRNLGAEKKPYLSRLWQFVVSPRGMLTTVGALASVAVFVLAQSGVFRSTPALIQVNLGSADAPASSAASMAPESATPSESTFLRNLRARTEKQDARAVLQLDRSGRQPAYDTGDRQRIGFRLEEDGSAVLLEERPDGTTYRLFPNRYQESAAVTRGQTVLVPPAGQGDLEVQAPAGHRVLHLIVFPSGVNPLERNNLDTLRDQAKEVNLPYEVKEKK